MRLSCPGVAVSDHQSSWPPGPLSSDEGSAFTKGLSSPGRRAARRAAPLFAPPHNEALRRPGDATSAWRADPPAHGFAAAGFPGGGGGAATWSALDDRLGSGRLRRGRLVMGFESGGVARLGISVGPGDPGLASVGPADRISAGLRGSRGAAANVCQRSVEGWATADLVMRVGAAGGRSGGIGADGGPTASKPDPTDFVHEDLRTREGVRPGFTRVHR